MLHNFLLLMTTTAVMAHALLGCCAHHTHAHEAGSCCAQREEMEEADNHAGHVHHSQSHDHHHDSKTVMEIPCDGDNHDGHEPCEEGDCQFVSGPRSDELTLAVSLDWLAVVDVIPTSIVSLHTSHGLKQIEYSRRELLPPEPLHALKQVWLL